MAAMLSHHGLPMSEPMAFGLGAGLAFAVIPFVKLAGMPMIAYRMPPSGIVRGLSRRLGIRMVHRRFRNVAAGMHALDEQLDAGRLVGLQTSVYWLPYFPEDMRFHFNAHNLIVYGRRGGEYLVSDPVFERPVTCDRAGLTRARFARGALAPRGTMYYPTHVPAEIDLRPALRSALRATLRTMTGAPVPYIGIRGIRHLGRRLARLERRGERRTLERFLVHIVRMQEEIGTGGAGFRFLYASFLEEAGEAAQSAALVEASARMTEAGDGWRAFALAATRMAKGRDAMDVPALIALLERCAGAEAQAWQVVRQAL
jgi:hypothetical protein